MRSKYDAANSGDSSFTNVQPFLNDGRAQHEECGEAAEDQVDQMRPVYVEMFPCHCESSEVVEANAFMSGKLDPLPDIAWSLRSTPDFSALDLELVR
jgi:hypothetical protein